MRIIAGRMKGRSLAAVGKGDVAAHLRPTTDRVRETLFNILTNHVDFDGLCVLDVFAGTGALGLEALSRGATRVSFIENGRVALGLLAQNIKLCNAEDQAQICRRDARRPGPGAPHDLVFLDPPYGKGLGEAAMGALIQQGWIAPGALVVWEDGTMPRLPDALTLRDQRAYGGTVLTLADMA